jgi:preprotein translocase subunit YajC
VSPGALVFVVVLILVVVMLARGPRRRQQVQQRMWDSLEQGDEIVTAGGIYGEITGFQGDDVLVRIAPTLEVRVARRAIAGVFKEEPEPAADEAEPIEEEPR